MYIYVDKGKYGHNTVYIKHSFRKENGKTSSKVIANLGRLEDLQTIHGDNYEKWISEQLKKYSDEYTQSTLITLSYDSSKQIEKNVENSCEGGYLFIKNVYYNLGLDKICKKIAKNHKFEYDLNDILSVLLFGRILFPKSKSGTFEYAKTLLEKPSFEQHDIYRALDVLAEESEFIQQQIYDNSLKLGKRNDRLIYYDCTNYYFEIESESGKRKHGISKQHQNTPIIGMGMMMDADGIPLAFDMYDGNRNEQTTLKPMEERLMRDYSHSKFVICTDAGLSSVANKKFNQIQDRAFITTQSLKKMKSEYKLRLMHPRGWKINGVGEKFDISEVINDEELRKKYHNSIFYKEEWFNINDVDQRMIVTFSIKYYNYQRKIRNEQIERAKRAISSGNKKDCSRNTDYKRFIHKISVTSSGEVAEKKEYSLDNKLIEDEEFYDGFYCVSTNLEDEAKDIAAVNSKRWEIEECFRIMKTEFKARPVYLSDEARIDAHFLTCFLSLILYRYLEKKVGYGYTCEDIINQLKAIKFHKTKEGYLPSYTRNDLTDRLHENFGFRTDYQIITNSKMKEILKTIKKDFTEHK